MDADLRRVIRTIKVVVANQLHVRVSLFDQHGASVGFLTMRPEDINDLILRLEPDRLIIPMHWPDRPENWNIPENYCQIQFSELTS